MRMPIIAAFTLAACGVSEPETTRSSLQRVTAQVDPAQLAEAIRGSGDFAFDLYRRAPALPGKENLVFSPHSISSAFGMLWAGARTTSDLAIATGLHYRFAQAEQHALHNHIDASLAARNETVDDEDKLVLEVVNDVWAQRGFEILPEYLDTLALNYGAGVRRLDFSGDAEGSRATINDWVGEKTRDRIPELFPQGSIDPTTALALTNAVYFKADWLDEFDASDTDDGPFTLLDGTRAEVPFMHRVASSRHHVTSEYTAVELPYVGEELALLVVMPSDLVAFEAGVSGAELQAIAEALVESDVVLSLPKWTLGTTLSLNALLTDMGMGELFIAPDLSGIDGTRDLYVQSAVHQAFIEVSEEGTEAAAATGISIGVTSAPAEPISISIDRPFFYALRDIETGAVLFLGRTLDPRVGALPPGESVLSSP